jgi:hypothetical protein
MIALQCPVCFRLAAFGLVFNEGQSRIIEQHPQISSPEDSCFIDFPKFNNFTIRVRVELFDNF